MLRPIRLIFLLRKKRKGAFDLTVLFIVVIVLLAIFLAGAGSSIKKNTGTDVYVPDTPEPPKQGENNLQLDTFKFIKVPQTMDCGEDTKGKFHEQYILWAMNPDPGAGVGPGDAIKIFYSDEWPITLGSGDVSAPNSSGHLVAPDLKVGDLSAKDSAGLPYFPALFLTDITTNPEDKSGDAENGGTPIPPHELWGTWKPLGEVNIFPQQETGGVLPQGADPFPPESNIKFEDNSYLHGVPHGDKPAEIIWHVDKLGLTSGHTYRAQFILHDGDSEGDVGEACTTIHT